MTTDRCDECRDDGFMRRAYEWTWTEAGLVVRYLPPAKCDECGKPLPARTEGEKGR